MDLRLKGRIAMVAAASAGIGKAAARTLAAEGAGLAICARTREVLESTAREIEQWTGSPVLAFPADVRREEDVRGFVQGTLARFGRIDICVANAGGPPSKPFSETTADDWRNAVELNLLSVVWFAREVLPVMQGSGWGRFLTITSVSVKQPLEGLVLSNAVRAGVNGLVKSLSNEYAQFGITVNNVCPGYTATDRLLEVAARLGPGAEERWTKHIPARRLAQPEEIADTIAFLCSERAAYISGEAIAVDGGFTRTVA